MLAEPTIGITVTVNAPSEFSRQVVFDHRVGKNAHPDGNGNWVIKEACLPHTLFRTRWKARQAASEIAVPASAVAT